MVPTAAEALGNMKLLQAMYKAAKEQAKHKVMVN